MNGTGERIKDGGGLFKARQEKSFLGGGGQVVQRHGESQQFRSTRSLSVAGVSGGGLDEIRLTKWVEIRCKQVLYSTPQT